jgi:small GTP-binding protein
MGCNISKKTLSEATGGDPDNDKKVLFLGLDNAGKSTLLFQMRDNTFKDTVPTVGLNVEQIRYKEMQYTLWDVSGQATRLWKHYFDKIHAVIFVIDSSDTERLAKAKVLLHKCFSDKDLATCPILIFANKQDLEERMSPDEIYEKLGITNVLASGLKQHVLFQKCSAKTSEGIWEGI